MICLKTNTPIYLLPATALIFLVSTLATVGTAQADTQRPSIVNGINTSVISDTRIRLSWNRPWDDNGIAGYNVYRDGSYYWTVTDTFYEDANARPGEQHDYQITAYDFSQNYSELSAVASARTTGSGTNVAPPAPQFDQSGNNNAGADRPNSPTGLRSQILNGNSFRLNWDQAQGSRQITGFNIYRDGSYITTVQTAEYVEPRIDWGRDYNYTVVAIDNTVKFSEPSAPLTVNTANGNSSQGTDNNQNQQPAQVQNDAGNNARSSSVPDGYRMIFSDEFRGSNLDSGKWNSSYRWGPYWIINSEQQFYVDRINNPDFGHNPFSFDGEHLNITAQRTPDWLLSRASHQPYLSGALTTYNKFRMRYGYVEIRARLPRGQGLWPAFWLLHQHDNDRRPEIDVMEMLGHQPNLVYNTYHWVENGSARRSPSFEVWGPDYSQDYHTYGMQWEPGRISWFVDGELRNQFVDGNVSWEEMYLLVNLAVGGWWPGNPNQETQFPATMSIDYIRAYQR